MKNRMVVMTTYKFVDKMGDAKCSRKHMTFS